MSGEGPELLAVKRRRPVNKAFSGTILVWGSVRKKRLFFEYIFDRREMVTNVIITVRVNEKEYDFLCHNRDPNNPLKSSDCGEPEFDITLPIDVIRVRPQVMWGRTKENYRP
jgi:hypothetical protein